MEHRGSTKKRQGNAYIYYDLYNKMIITGDPPYPRYIVMRFPVPRVHNERALRLETPERTRLRGKVQELREQGMSYPQIAKALGISVGTAWNLNHTQ